MVRSSLTGRGAALILVAVAGCAGVVIALSAGRPLAAALIGIAVACALALAARAGGPGADAGRTLTEILDGILLALPGALVVFFSFNSGGYFPDIPATGALVLIVVLVLRVTVAEEPFAAFSRGLAVATAALGLLAIWILLSAVWSDTTARALVEFNRAFLYLLLLVVSGSVARTSTRLRVMAAFVAAGVLVVAITALATRLAPDHFPTSIPAIGESNLAYPLTYSNALGILCVLGAIVSFYFATSVQQPRAVRALGSAALPLLATTVYLTLSRGPVAAAIAGIAAYVVLGRPRGLLTALAATVPTSAVAIASAYQHPVLTSNSPQAAEAAAQGHRVALVLVLCVVVAGVIRMALTPLDERLRIFSLPERSRRPVLFGSWAAVAVAVLIVALALDAPSTISDQYNRFVDSGQASPGQDVRQSVFSSANRGLVDNWSVALDAFKDSPLHGQGAASYENWWNEHRPARQAGYGVTDGHSLYVEMLGELGIVGVALLAILLVAMLAALLPLRSRGNRQLYAALFSVTLAWCLHAAVDWDWEMPAVTVPAIAFGGAALAAHEGTILPSFAAQGTRVVIGILALAGALAPALVLVSQHQLNDARTALRDGNCARAIDRATASIDTLAIRPEPYETLGICQQQRGRTGLGVQAMREAVERDPDNWRYHFELGVLLGGIGQNVRPELLAAQRLNPSNPDVAALLKDLPAGEAVNWDLELQGPQGASAEAP